MASGSKPPASLQSSNAAGRETKKSVGLDESPLIPLSIVDAPTQRVYIASSFVFVQTYKLYTLTPGIWTDDDFALLGKFLLLDFLFVIAVSRLRTPRLDYTRSRWIAIFSFLAILDWLITGGWRSLISLIGSLPILGWIADTVINTWTDTFNQQVSISEHRVRLKDLIRPSHHILGQHTIHVLPFSTATFSTTGKSTSNIPSCFCLDTENPKAELSIPLLFNNTEPQFLSYSISPIGSSSEEDKVVYNITIPKSNLIRLRGKRKEVAENGEDALDMELDDADDEVEEEKAQRLALVRHGEQQALSTNNRNPQQRKKNGDTDGHEIMFNLPIKSPGRIRLERVLDRNHFDARLSRSEILVVECPKMGFTPKDGASLSSQISAQDFCPGDAATMDVWVKGFAPLKLQYSRFSPTSTRHDSEKQSFTISHISNSNGDNLSISSDDRADQIAMALKGSKQKQLQSLAQAESRNITLPITIDTSKEGRRTYRLESIQDACGNEFEPEDRAMRYYEEVHVHSRPTVVFESCSADKPIELLQGGPSREIGIRVEGVEADEAPFITQIGFEGEGESWTNNITMNKRSTITIDKPGMYSLGSVTGRYCSGEAGARWSCLARVVPPPTASIQFDAIQDPCSGPVGVKALAVLSGSPPFKVKYRVERKGRQVREYEEVIKRTREEIEFRPSTEGEVTYTFTGLSDSNYQNIDLDGPSFTQVLHPVASASFNGGKQASVGPTIALQSCQGNLAKAQIALEGVGPFEMKYALRANGGQILDTRTVKNIQKSPFDLDVEVPKEMAEKGGSLNVALISIKDAKGCERPLTVPDLTVNVFRTKPSVSFVEPRKSSMLDDKQIQLPIRVAGEGPWTVRYRQQGKDVEPIEIRLDQADSFLTIAEPGTYEIVEVRDSHCPGIVLKSRETHVVTTKPRPTAKFDDQGNKESNDVRMLIRSPVCLGTPDSVDLQVQGHFPVSIAYRHIALQGSQIAKEDRFNAAQTRTSLQLDTETEGVHEYELMQIGDAVYQPKSLQSGKGIRLQQTIFPLPFAGFKHSGNEKAKQISLCLGEALSESDKERSIPSITLSGTPPFTIEYAIKDSTGAIRKTLTKNDIPTNSYTLKIEEKDFPFDVTGKWSVDLVRVIDGNGCERSLVEVGSGAAIGGKPSSSKSNLEIEVVESANISPVGTRTDYCVGESIGFVLQGSPPWTVSYNFEGHISRATVKTTTFSRIAEQPGILQVEAIAHQHNRCQTTVKEKVGMKKVIHALPTVHIREGSHFVEDLREGNQAEIVFKLGGEPPFSFTYQRTQAIDRFTKPEVLEIHTVTGIEDHSFTIQTAEEGTWSVIWLQDKWCAISIDMGSDGKNQKGIKGEPRRMIVAP